MSSARSGEPEVRVGRSLAAVVHRHGSFRWYPSREGIDRPRVSRAEREVMFTRVAAPIRATLYFRRTRRDVIPWNKRLHVGLEMRSGGRCRNTG